MRLRYTRSADYFSLAAEEAYSKCSHFSFGARPIQNDMDHLSMLPSATIELLISDVHGLDEVAVSSDVEGLLFENVFKQFIGEVYPHTERNELLGNHEMAHKLFKESTISSPYLWLEVPEILDDHFSIMQNFSNQVILDVKRMGDIYMETKTTLFLPEDKLRMEAEVVSITNAYAIECAPLNTQYVCQDGEQELHIQNIENMNSDLIGEMFAANCKHCHPFEGGGNLLQFEGYSYLDDRSIISVNIEICPYESNSILWYIKQELPVVLDIAALHSSAYLTCDSLSMELFSKEFSNTFKPGFLLGSAENHLDSENMAIKELYESNFFDKIMEGALRDEQKLVNIEEHYLFDDFYVPTFTWFSSLVETKDINIEEPTESSLLSERAYDNLVVEPDLTLSDKFFKSLPIPVFLNDVYEPAHSSFLHMLLTEDMVSTSASDWLYLDWHYSLRGMCNNLNCLSLQTKIENCETYSLMPSAVSYVGEETVNFNIFEFFEENLANHNENARLGIAENITSDVQLPNLCTVSSATHENIQKLEQPISKKSSSLFRDISVTNDLSIFLTTRKGLVRDGDHIERKQSTSKDLANLDVTESSYKFSSITNFSKNEIEIHSIDLPDHVLKILDSIQSCCEIILEMQNELKLKLNASSSMKCLLFLQEYPIQLFKLITERASQSYTLSNDPVLRSMVALHVLQETAFRICFYGFQVAFLYMNKMTRNLLFLKDILHEPYCIVKDANQRSEIGDAEEHPLIGFVESILKSDTLAQDGKKMLLVCEGENFSLCKKLVILHRKIFEFQWKKSTREKGFAEEESIETINQCIRDLTSKYNCLMVSHKNITASFPIECFDIIVEYGDSHLSTKFSSIIRNIEHSCKIYFLRIKLKGNEFLPQKLEDEANLMDQVKQEETKCWLSSLLQTDEENQYNLKEPSCNHMDGEENNFFKKDANEPYVLHSTIQQACDVQLDKSERGKSLPNFPSVIVIANITAFDKEMISARRTSYQKILSLEKEGLQVVEREYHLPVDLILSPATCLVMYTQETLKRYASVLEETALTSCIANIADSFLMSVSIAFEVCILIFEGESNFLNEVMKASDDLYAAAAGLGIHLQCFMSRSAEMTDSIILNCIRKAMAGRNCSCPAMLESETLAESFLTKFASLNPFSAHAILSYSDSLSNLLSPSSNYQTFLVQKLGVPAKSLSLFTSEVSCGQLSEAKSSTTECLSTVNCPCPADNRRNITYPCPEKSEITVNKDANTTDLDESSDASISTMSPYHMPRTQQLESSTHERTTQVGKLKAGDPFFEVDDSCIHLNDVLGERVNWECTFAEEKSYQGREKTSQIDIFRSENSQADAYGDLVRSNRNLHQGTFDIPDRSYREQSPCIEMNHMTASFNCPVPTAGALDGWDDIPCSTVCGPTYGKTKMETHSEDEIIEKSPFREEYCQAESSNRRNSIRNAINRLRSQRAQRVCRNSEPTYRANDLRLKDMLNLRKSADPHLQERCSKRIKNAFPDLAFGSSIWSSRNARKPLKANTLEKYRYCVPTDGPKTLDRKGFSKLGCSGTGQERDECKRQWQCLLNYQGSMCTPNKSRSALPSFDKGQTSLASPLQSWTPLDKRAKQRLTFAEVGSNKQSRLVWRDSISDHYQRRKVNENFPV